MTRRHVYHHPRSMPPTSPCITADFSSRLPLISLSSRARTALTLRIQTGRSLPYLKHTPLPVAPHGTSSLRALSSTSAHEHFLEKAKALLKSRITSHPAPLFRHLSNAVKKTRFAVCFTWSHNAKQSVFLIGSFIGWGVPIAMRKRPSSHGSTPVWKCILLLPVGQYIYKYVVDGQLRVDSLRLCEFVKGIAIANKLVIGLSDVL